MPSRRRRLPQNSGIGRGFLLEGGDEDSFSRLRHEVNGVDHKSAELVVRG
jgi:hypothetical protein